MGSADSEPLNKPSLEAVNRRSFMTSGGGIDSEDEQVFAVITKVNFSEFREAVDEEVGRDQQNHGNSHLSNYKDFPGSKTPMRPFTRPTGWSGLQEWSEIEAR